MHQGRQPERSGMTVEERWECMKPGRWRNSRTGIVLERRRESLSWVGGWYLGSEWIAGSLDEAIRRCAGRRVLP
jgi:hypothetical protein